MKRHHRRWHRIIGALLLPALAWLLAAAWWGRDLPPRPADLPPALINTDVQAR